MDYKQQMNKALRYVQNMSHFLLLHLYHTLLKAFDSGHCLKVFHKFIRSNSMAIKNQIWLRNRLHTSDENND